MLGVLGAIGAGGVFGAGGAVGGAVTECRDGLWLCGAWAARTEAFAAGVGTQSAMGGPLWVEWKLLLGGRPRVVTRRRAQNACKHGQRWRRATVDMQSETTFKERMVINT